MTQSLGNSASHEERLSEFQKFYLSKFALLNDAVGAITKILSGTLDELKEELAVHDVSGRAKAFESCIQKYNDKYRKANESSSSPKRIDELLTDLIGIRIVCLYEDDIEKISEKVRQTFEVVGKTDKIETMNQNVDRFGYKALHYDLHLGAPRGVLGEYRRFSGLNVELQIRTIFQDAWSVIDHQLKYKHKLDLPLGRRINVFAALCELADQEFVRIRDDIRATPTDIGLSSGQRIGVGTLDLRGFLEVLRSSFPADPILPDQADVLLATIKRLDPTLTKEHLANMFDKWGAKVHESYQEFKAKRHRTFSPLTRTRALLSVAQSDKFDSLVTSPDLRALVERARKEG